MSNIDFEIGQGNPAAIAIRFHVAQHGILSHVDFHVGSSLASGRTDRRDSTSLRTYGAPAWTAAYHLNLRTASLGGPQGQS